ncbi:MAG TPA: hypothetical protein VIT42_07855 [Microlunatus sp.]
MFGGNYTYWGFLALCLMIVVALAAVVVARTMKRFGPPSRGTAARRLPDFTVIDTGQTIHFVPIDGIDHHVDDVGRCPCGPRRTGNRRRGGHTVVYVDHATTKGHHHRSIR